MIFHFWAYCLKCSKNDVLDLEMCFRLILQNRLWKSVGKQSCGITSGNIHTCILGFLILSSWYLDLSKANFELLQLKCFLNSNIEGFTYTPHCSISLENRLKNNDAGFQMSGGNTACMTSVFSGDLTHICFNVLVCSSIP